MWLLTTIVDSTVLDNLMDTSLSFQPFFQLVPSMNPLFQPALPFWMGYVTEDFHSLLILFLWLPFPLSSTYQSLPTTPGPILIPFSPRSFTVQSTVLSPLLRSQETSPRVLTLVLSETLLLKKWCPLHLSSALLKIVSSWPRTLCAVPFPPPPSLPMRYP